METLYIPKKNGVPMYVCTVHTVYVYTCIIYNLYNKAIKFSSVYVTTKPRRHTQSIHYKTPFKIPRLPTQ